MAAVLPTDIAQAITYGPKTAQAIRRSQYLADALKQNLDAGQNIRGGWGEMGARLLAQAILNRATDKAQTRTIEAMKGDQDAETERMMGGLRPPEMPSAPPTAPAGLVSEDTAPPSGLPPPSASGMPTTTPPIAPASSGMRPADREAMARAVWGEARGEPAAGQQAVASVILNRAKATGKSPAEIVSAPHQFAGYNARSQALAADQLAPIMANIDPILSGQAPDQTGGADHFFNPALAHPSWGQGAGQMIGQHKFMRLDDQHRAGPAPADVQMTGGPPPQGPMQVAPSMAAAQQGQQPPAEPYQVAATGPTPPPPQQPSAPQSSPAAVGGPPPAQPPQATAGGGSPPMRQVAQWPMWKPSNAETAWVEGMLRDPRTHQAGVQAAMAMRQKMTQPVEATMQMVNGVPVYFGKDPTDGAVMVMPVPKEAMTQVMPAQAAGLPGAPQGLNVQRDPLGNLKDAPGAPPAGYQTDGHGGYAPIHNGPADPRREQPAGQGYRYADAGRQEAIPGSGADPRSPANLAQGVLSFKKDLDPIVTNAVKVRQNYGAVVTGIRQQNGTGDIAAINGLQKLIDDGVVKGEDVNMQMRSNGLSGTLGGYAEYLKSGGLLTPEIRAKVAKTAGELYHNLDGAYRARVMSMAPAVDEIYGPGAFGKYVFPQAMVEQMGWGGQAGAAPSDAPGPGAAPPQFTPGSLDGALAEAVKRRLPLSPAQQARARQLGLM